MQVIKGIIIKPIANEWVSTSPFGVALGSDKGFVFAEGDLSSCSELDDYTQIDSLLMKLGNVSNSIDFLEKTRSQKNITVKGIGGFAKLKDFNFTLLNQISDHLALYGKKMIYFRVLDTVYKEDFLGKIQKVTKIQDMIEVSCEAYTSLSNDTFLVENASNNIFIGNPFNGYIKLFKEEDTNRLIFESWVNYTIKGIYISGRDSNEMFEVKNVWEQEGKYIYIKTGAELILKNKMSGSVSGYDTYTDDFAAVSGGTARQTALVSNMSLVEITFDNNSNTNLIEKVTYASDVDMYFYPIDTVQSNIKIFETSSELLNPLIINKLKEMSDQDVICTKIGGGVITKRVLYVKVKQQGRTVPLGDKFFDEDNVSSHVNNHRFYEYENEYIQSDTLYPSTSINGSFPMLKERDPNKFIIKIGDEKMLVLSCTRHMPDSDMIMWDTVTMLRVVRGYENTVIAEHAANSYITVISDIKPILYLNVQSPLTGLHDLPFRVGFNSIEYNNFFKDPYNVDRKIQLIIRDNLKFRQMLMGLNFQVPSLTGNIINIKLVGYFTFIYTSTFGGSGFHDPQYTKIACFLSCKMVGDDVPHQFLFFGTNDLNTSKVNYIYDSYVTTDPNFPTLLNDIAIAVRTQQYNLDTLVKYGKFIHRLEGCWDIIKFQQTSLSQYMRELRLSYIDDKEETLRINTIADLEKANLSYRIVDLRFCFPGNTTDGEFNMCGIPIELGHTYLDMDLEVTMSDNDFYAKVLSSDTILVNVSTLLVGDNFTGFLRLESNGIVYYFFSSDTYKIGVITVSPVGLITLVTSKTFTLTLAGALKFFIRMDSRYYFAIAEGAIFKIIEVSVSSGTPVIGDIQSVNTLGQYEVVSKVPIYIDNIFTLLWEANYIKVKKIISTVASNPVSVIKKLLFDYLNMTVDDLDMTAFNLAQDQTVNQKCSLLIESSSSLNEVLDSIAKEHGLILFENNQSKISIIYLIPPSTITKVIDDSMIVFDGKKASIEIEYTDMDYLISEMDINYFYFNNKYEKVIKSIDADWLKNYFDKAKVYLNGSKSKVILNLATVSDLETVKRNSTLKMQYHFKPSRLIKLKLVNIDTFSLGDWVELDSSYIESITDKNYLIIDSEIETETNLLNVTLYEFVLSEYFSNYQEVPVATKQLQESDVATDQITETPNYLI